VQKVIFSNRKQRVAVFDAQTLDFAREPTGLLLTAEGEMIFQDTAAIEELVNHCAECGVTILKDGETVIDQTFRTTFFTLEADALAVLLE
jgi:hypothetical protein